MIKFKVLLIIAGFLFAGSLYCNAQDNQPVIMKLNLDQTIEIAQQKSIQSFRNKNMYLARYWEFKSYKGSKLPGLILESNPLSYNSSYRRVYDSQQNKYVYKYDDRLTSYGKLSINQNVTVTGGTISLYSDLTREQDYSDDLSSFVTNPISLSFDQPLSGYNEFRWQSRLAPLEYEIAKREFLQGLETISLRAVDYFFSLVSNEIDLKIANTNFSNADTLYTIAKGRFEIGTVTQDELLDLELGLLNARINKVKAEMSLKQAQIAFNSFLRLDESIEINCIIPDEIPTFDLEVGEVLDLALENNPDLLDFQRQLLVARQKVANEKANSGFTANMHASFGLSNSADNIIDSYRPEFQRGQSFGFGLRLPILDWGDRRGRIQMVKAEQVMTEAQVEQAKVDFNQNVLQLVMEFNVQDDQVEISAKADTVAVLGYDVTKQRFLIGKLDVIKLNSARNSVDAAHRNYGEALHRYWNYYYSIRQLTLYDFMKKQSLIEELDYLLEK